MNELFPFIYQGLGNATDHLSTALYCSKYGTSTETNKTIRKIMEDQGVGKGLLKRGLEEQAVIWGIGGGLFLCDRIIGLGEDPINLHKIWLYGIGTALSLVTLNNLRIFAISLLKK